MSENSIQVSMRSALKWAGGKKKLASQIEELLLIKGKQRLIEPFVGGGSVFLNVDVESYLLVDINKDLINFFNNIKYEPIKFISEAEYFFKSENNITDRYYELREEFNKSTDTFHRSLIFLYLNRHGYNGLCRYNQSGGYNVPFGRYKKPYFPKPELEFIAERSQRAEFIQGDFEEAFSRAVEGDVIYCDPPYSPINRTSNFTSYSGNAFGDEEQMRLVKRAEEAREKGIATLISNHDLDFTRKIYTNADKLSVLKVHRSISRNGKGRVEIDELMALYSK